MMEERRRAQAAADAAALAAGKTGYDQLHLAPIRQPSPTPLIQAATQSLNNAGYTNDGNTTWISINIGPSSGPFAGNASYIEVIVQTKVRATFGRIFTGSDPTVKARAVAQFQRKHMGLVVLDPSADKALDIPGAADIVIKNEAVHVNSTSGKAAYVASNATLTADSVDIVGGLLGSLVGILNTGASPVQDPLADLPAPNLASYPVMSTVGLSINASTTLQPGIYQGGINVSGGTVTLSSGIYILDGGGFTVSGSASVVGNGVMIYNVGGKGSGPIKIGGQAALTLNPPSIGPYAGISIFQDRSSTQTLQLKGSGDLNVTGAIYAQGAKIEVNGNGQINGTLLGFIVCNTVQMGGQGQILISMTTDPPTTYRVRLVE